MAQPFFIFFIERAGSTHLVSLLQSHPEILCGYEIFGPQGFAVSPPATAEERMKLLEKSLTASEGFIKAAGFKLKFPSQIGYYPDVWEKLLSMRDDIRVIVLRRENVVRQALSTLYRNCWIENGVESIPLMYTPLQNKTTVNIANFHRIIALYADLNEKIDEAASAFTQKINVTYEDITERKEETMRALTSFLGVSPEWALHSATDKVTPTELDEWIENSNEVRTSLQSTQWAGFL